MLLKVSKRRRTLRFLSFGLCQLEVLPFLLLLFLKYAPTVPLQRPLHAHLCGVPECLGGCDEEYTRALKDVAFVHSFPL